MEKMRAAQFVEPGRMACEETDVRPPKQGELLVKTHRASICGSDLHVIFMGFTLFPPPSPPGYPGHEGIGEVVESLDGRFDAGDLVLTCPWPTEAGCFAEYQTLSADFCLKLPAYGGPSEDLMMAQQLGSVLYAFRKKKLDLHGKTVMVMGQGSAGQFFGFLAKRAGAAKVIASDKSEARLALSPAFGVDVAVMAKGDNVAQAVMDNTDGHGVDMLIEAVGSRESLLQSVDLVRVGGEMLMFGLPDTNEPVPFNFHDFFRKKLLAYSDYGAQHEPDLVSFDQGLKLIANGEIDVSAMVSHTLPIEKIDEAVHLAHERSGNALKVSIDFP